MHPTGAAIAVAVGPELRVYDVRTGQHHTLISKPEELAPAAKQPAHAARGAVPFVRGVAFDPSGRYLLAGTEDKSAGLRLWDAATWQLLQSIKVPKKVANCAFTADGRHMLGADKFGDVLVAATQRPAGLAEGQEQEPEILLGHYCAILTSLSLSAGGRLLATTDRDNRVRVSIMPAEPLAGAPEIQTLCFGHTAFVACSAFVQHDGQELLATGGGDGTLRLWDPVQGTLLQTLELPAVQQPAAAAGAAAADGQQQGEGQQEEQPQQEEQQQQEGEDKQQAAEEGGSGGDDGEAQAVAGGGEVEEGGEEAGAGGTPGGLDYTFSDAPVPLAIAASPDGRWLVAAVDGRDDLCLLRLDWSARQICEVGWFTLPGLHLPAFLAFDATSRLWAAGGPVADKSTAAFLACGCITGEGPAAVLAAAPLPDWLPAEAAAAVQAKVGTESELLSAAAERRRLSSQQLQKRQYSLAALEHRKRMRRDKTSAAGKAGGEQKAAAGR